MRSGPWRAFAIVLGLVVLAALAAWAAVAMLLPAARVRGLVERQLAATMAREVRFDAVSVGVLPPVRLEVRGLAIAEPGGFERGVALEVPRLGLDLDPFALLRRELRVRRLVFEQPALHLVIRADGTTNFDRMMKPAPPGADTAAGRPLDLDLAAIEIDDARVLLDRVAEESRIAFRLGSRLSFSSRDGGARLATAGRTRVEGLASGPLTATRLADLDQDLARLTWSVQHEGIYDANAKKLALGRLDLAFGRTAIGLTGVVADVGATPLVDLRTRAGRVDLGEVLDALSVADARALAGIAGSGDLAFDLAIRGRLAPRRRPVVTGTLSVRDGSFRYAGSGTSVDRLAFDARFAPDSISIPVIQARVANQPVRAALEARRLADPWVRFAVEGDLDLTAVAPLIAPEDTRLGGRADVDVAGSGPARDPGSMSLTGRARLFNVELRSPRTPKPWEKINGELTFSSARAAVRGFTLEAGGSSLAFDGSVDRPLAILREPGSTAPAIVEFTLRSPLLDVAEIAPRGDGGIVLPNARGGGVVEIARFRNGPFDVARLSARVGLEPGVLAVPSLAFDGYGGAVRGSGRFDFRDPALPEIRLDVAVDSVEADLVLSTWTAAKDWVRGSLSGTAGLGVVGTQPAEVRRTLTAVGNATFANGSLGPGPVLEEIARVTRIPRLETVRFRDVRAPFRVENGRVVTDPVRISGPAGEWTAVGAIGFNGALDYAISITLPPDVAAALEARAAIAAGALADEQGRVLIDLRVAGTARAPRVSLDGEAMRQRLAGRVSQAIADQRGRLEEAVRDRVPGLGAADSLRARRDSLARAAADSVRRAARGALEGFFRPRAGADTTR